MEPRPRLRLLKMMMQPVYVLDDGETLEEQRGQAFEITEAQIDAFPAAWAERFAEIRAEVEGPDIADAEPIVAAEGGDDGHD